MNSKIIVMGSTGFIGKAVYNNLVMKNIDCIGLSSKEADLLTAEGTLNFKNTLNNNDKIIFPFYIIIIIVTVHVTVFFK